jgi:ABC-type transport system involved in cytochrome c biogenesis permease subunit
VAMTHLAGLAIGLWLGFIWVVWGFGDMVLVALVGIVGYLVARVLTGQLRVDDIADRMGIRR